MSWLRRSLRRDPLMLILRVLTVLTAVSLALTGQVNVPLACLVPLAVWLGARWEARDQRPGRKTEVVFHVLAVAGLLYFFAQAAGRLQLLTGSVALIFIGQAYYALRPPDARVVRRLQLLAFFQILALASTTTHILFLIPFLLYLGLAPLAFTLQALEATRAPRERAREPEPPEARQPAPVQPGLLRASLVASALALAAAAALFPLVPRYEAGLLSQLNRQEERDLSGFSDRVRFGEINGIKTSNRVVMRARVKGPVPSDFRWRGIVLDRYDGRAWSLSLQETRRVVPTAGWRGEPAFMTRPVDPRDSLVAEASVFLEPVSTRVLFHPAGTSLVATDELGGVDRDAWGNLYTPMDRRSRLAYDVVVSGAGPPPTLEDWERRRTLSLPPLDPRIQELARSVTEGSESPAQQARLLEQWLSSQLGYTLEVDDRGAEDPLARFLFESREGHCEYFASAMTVMARTLDLPARMVNGFQRGRYSRLTGSWTVRMRDAHAWVEVWLPDRGWTAYDPTPPAGQPEAQSLLTDLRDALELGVQYWDDHVIGFNIYSQLNAWLNVRDTLVNLIGRAGPTIRTLFWPVLLPGLLAVALLAGWILHRRLRRGEGSPKAGTPWMDRLLRDLEGRGWKRGRGETLARWASRLRDEAGSSAEGLEELVRLYYTERFGGDRADRERLRDLMGRVEGIPPAPEEREAA